MGQRAPEFGFRSAFVDIVPSSRDAPAGKITRQLGFTLTGRARFAPRIAIDSFPGMEMPQHLRFAALALGALLAACSSERPAQPPRPAAAAPAPPVTEAFLDATVASGLSFTHTNGMTGDFYLAEIIGSGVALLDYDNDGDLDILALQGTPLTPGFRNTALGSHSARLFRNDLTVNADGTRTLRFTDVTEASGLHTTGYGMGVAVGDIDNDGFVDVFITSFGSPNQLFRNNGNGTFTDATRKARLEGAGRWGASATFFDYDRDGLLDLYVTHYVDFTLATNQKCYANTSARDYCAPVAYKPVAGLLYRNRGNGVFEDVSVKSGITRAFGNGLGVIALDANADGWPDLYVANDGTPNQLWINRRDGTFAEEAGVRGVAVNADGAPEAGMGVDLGDWDANGSEDIVVTNLTREKTTLYVNLGKGVFEDRSAAVGLTAATTAYTGFGTAFIDYDNDGWLDIVQANGAVHGIEALIAAGDKYPLHQKKVLLRNTGNGRFVDAGAAAGAAFARSEVGRSLAVGDLDNDGDTDVVIGNSNGPLRLLANQVGSAQPWIGLRLVTGKRDAYGARVEVRRKDAPALWRRVRADGSYLSANDPRVLVGLGKAAQVEGVRVFWPDGAVESFPPPPLKTYSTLVRGTGRAEKP
jgi:hypothetical protein